MNSRKPQHQKKMDEIKSRVTKTHNPTASGVVPSVAGSEDVSADTSQPTTQEIPGATSVGAGDVLPNGVQAVDQGAAPSQSQLTADQEAALRQEIAELKAKNLRLLADSQNLMRQYEMNVSQARKAVKKEISLCFVDFVSNMNLAFNFVPTDADKAIQDFVENLKASLEKSLQTLKNYGIEIIVPKSGEVFNPEYMTGINEAPVDQDSPTIKSVVSVGLKIENQVVKPAVITF